MAKPANDHRRLLAGPDEEKLGFLNSLKVSARAHRFFFFFFFFFQQVRHFGVCVCVAQRAARICNMNKILKYF